MNINDLLVELDKRDTLLANDAASKIRELIKENERLRGQWPFPPPEGPTPWTRKQIREYDQKQLDQMPDAPM